MTYWITRVRLWLWLWLGSGILMIPLGPLTQHPEGFKLSSIGTVVIDEVGNVTFRESVQSSGIQFDILPSRRQCSVDHSETDSLRGYRSPP